MPYLELSEDFKPYYEIHDCTDPWKPAEMVLFVHGFTENTTCWRGWIPYLARNYRLLLLDLRGFGNTGSVAESFKFSTEVVVDDLVRVINHLADGPVHVVAAKSGCISVMNLAATRPDLVKSLTLACPPLSSPGNSDWVQYMAEHGMRDWARVTMPARLGQNTDTRCVDWWVGNPPVKP